MFFGLFLFFGFLAFFLVPLVIWFSLFFVSLVFFWVLGLLGFLYFFVLLVYLSLFCFFEFCFSFICRLCFWSFWFFLPVFLLFICCFSLPFFGLFCAFVLVSVYYCFSFVFFWEFIDLSVFLSCFLDAMIY